MSIIVSNIKTGLNKDREGIFETARRAAKLEKSQIESDVVPVPTDRIITLSTCTGVGYESRRVVHAYLKMIPAE